MQDSELDDGQRALALSLQQLTRRLLHELMQQAGTHHAQGRLDAAEMAYHAVLRENPRHADANHNLAVIALGDGDCERALRHFQQALDVQPERWQYWVSYLDALIQFGQLWTAAEGLEDARRAGLAAEAVDELLERMLHAHGAAALQAAAPAATAGAQASSDSRDSACAMSGADVIALTELFNTQRHAALEDLSRRLAARFPANPLGWRMLVLALNAQRREPETLLPMRHLAALCPRDADNLNALGMLLTDRSRLIEAEFSFNLALALAPAHRAACSNLGMVLQRRGRLQQAEVRLRQCIALDPAFAVAQLNLSVVLDEMGRSDEAEASVRRALQINPAFVEAHNSLGFLLKDQGRIEEAEASTRRALALAPLNAAANSNLLFLLNYHPDKPAEEIFKAYAQYDARLGLPHRAQWQAHANPRDPLRRLRLGYVCPTFSNHSTRHFLEPLLAHHDRLRFERVAYSEMVSAQDAATLRYRSCFDRWVDTADLSDDALAQRIRDDGIDVLIDIAGHTRGNRLGVFARKPAPVSLHWLDFGATTGLSAIDYYLTDQPSAPHGSDGLFAEAPWRLPVPAFAYRPGPGMGDPGPLPVLARGHITFGTLTRAIRINHRTIRVWSQILLRMPGSRLVIDSGNFKTAASCDAMAARFREHGIARDRLEIGCHSPPWDVLRGIDIGLDCFPHNSGTTLFEMVHQGVPYVTLAGRPSVGRLGSAILEGLGRSEWVAHSESDYVDKVIALATDTAALHSLRASLRAEMQDSPLMDEPGFTRAVEAAFVQMFARWSAGEPARGPAADVPALSQSEALP